MSFVLVLILITVSLFGCGSNQQVSNEPTPEPTTEGDTSDAVDNEEEEPKYPEEINIVGFNWGWDEAIPGEDLVGPEIEKALGYKVNFNFQKVGSYEEVEKKLQLWAASGADDWPNICYTGMSNITKDVVNRLGKSGMLMDWNTLMDRMPKVKEAVKYSQPLHNYEGKNYILPQNWSDLKAYKLDPQVWLREDWLEEVNLPYPKTVEEFENVLRTFKEKIKDPDGNPVIPYIAFGENFLWQPGWFIPEDKFKWQFINDEAVNMDIEDPQYLINALKKYNQWYNEGLIDQESFTLKQGQIDEKSSAGRVGAVHGAYWQVNPYTNILQEKDESAMFVGAPALYDAETMDSPNPFNIALEIWAGYNVRADIPEEELNALINFLEYSMTEEGFLLEWWGVKDKHWQFDSNNKIVDTPDSAERLKGDWNLRAHEGIQWYTGLSNYELIVQYTAPTTFDTRADMVGTWKNLGREYPEAYSTNLNKYITPGPIEVQKSLGSAERYKQMIRKAITASSPDEVEKTVSAWIETEKAMGYEEIKAERTELCKVVNVKFNY